MNDAMIMRIAPESFATCYENCLSQVMFKPETIAARFLSRLAQLVSNLTGLAATVCYCLGHLPLHFRSQVQMWLLVAYSV